MPEIKIQQRGQGRAYLLVACSMAPDSSGFCKFPLWTKEAGGVMWHWDGNTEQPTITPSVDCKGGCGFHLVVTKGKT